MEIICKHLRLKKQLVGNSSWYKCLSCPQKFKVTEWDGKVIVQPRATPNPNQAGEER